MAVSESNLITHLESPSIVLKVTPDKSLQDTSTQDKKRFPEDKQGPPRAPVANAAVRSGYYLVTGYAFVRAYDYSDIKAECESMVMAFDNARVSVTDRAAVKAVDDAQIEATGSSTVVAGGKAVVRARGDSFVQARGKSIIHASGNAKVLAFPGSTVYASGCSRVELMSREGCRIYLSENARATVFGE
jgi:hypothetical protein